jgi:hypothetical protein
MAEQGQRQGGVGQDAEGAGAELVEGLGLVLGAVLGACSGLFSGSGLVAWSRRVRASWSASR